MIIGTIETSYGKADVHRLTYLGPDGPTAISLVGSDYGEQIATLSVNMYRPECSHDSGDLPKDCFYAKTYGENELVAAEALASGLFIERTDLPKARSGYIEAPVWQIAQRRPIGPTNC